MKPIHLRYQREVKEKERRLEELRKDKKVKEMDESRMRKSKSFVLSRDQQKNMYKKTKDWLDQKNKRLLEQQVQAMEEKEEKSDFIPKINENSKKYANGTNFYERQENYARRLKRKKKDMEKREYSRHSHNPSINQKSKLIAENAKRKLIKKGIIFNITNIRDLDGELVNVNLDLVDKLEKLEEEDRILKEKKTLKPRDINPRLYHTPEIEKIIAVAPERSGVPAVVEKEGVEQRKRRRRYRKKKGSRGSSGRKRRSKSRGSRGSRSKKGKKSPLKSRGRKSASRSNSRLRSRRSASPRSLRGRKSPDRKFSPKTPRTPASKTSLGNKRGILRSRNQSKSPSRASRKRVTTEPSVVDHRIHTPVTRQRKGSKSRKRSKKKKKGRRRTRSKKKKRSSSLRRSKSRGGRSRSKRGKTPKPKTGAKLKRPRRIRKLKSGRDEKEKITRFR